MMSIEEKLNIQIERKNLERVAEVYDAIHESMDDLFPRGMSHHEIAIDELLENGKQKVEAWDKDDIYIFHIVDVTLNQSRKIASNLIKSNTDLLKISFLAQLTCLI